MVHGTDLSRSFRRWYRYARRHYVSPVRGHPPEWLTFYCDPDVGVNFKTLAARAWLLETWFLIPHDRPLARLLFEGAKRRFLTREADGAASFTSVSGCPGDDPFATVIGLALAHELGDARLQAGLRRVVASRYEPTRDPERGEFYYGFGLGEAFPRGQYNDFAMLAHVGAPGSWWTLFNRPNRDKRRQPTVHGVDLERLDVVQAWYDAPRRTLAVSIAPAGRAPTGGATAFRVRHPSGWRKPSVQCDGGRHRAWTAAGQDLEIATTVGEHRFLVRAG